MALRSPANLPFKDLPEFSPFARRSLRRLHLGHVAVSGSFRRLHLGHVAVSGRQSFSFRNIMTDVQACGWSKKIVCKDSRCISTANSSPEEDLPWVPSEESGQSPELGQKVALNLPRRRLQVSFTCNACGKRSHRLVNPHAYARGTVFVQCAGCEVYHKLADNLGLIEEIDYRLESDPKTDESKV